MYVTRPLSMYRNLPSTVSIQPLEAPYSGYMVITDEESEAQDTFCWGACKSRRVEKLPFPQDKILYIVHSSEVEETTATKVWFIPVLDQPLSLNRYYVISARGNYKGQACICSREEDMGTCCFSDVIKDIKPKPFDHRDIYQQVEIRRSHRGGFFAKSIAPDGFPPHFLRRKGWEVHTSSSFESQLREARGLNTTLRMLLPEFNFPISNKHSASLVVGKWYCPFVFVKEKARLKDQMKKSMFYEITLEQWWEEIYSCENESDEGDVVSVNMSVRREVTLVYGMEAMKDDSHGLDGFIWYRVHNQNRRTVASVGLSLAIVEKMRRVQEEGGWVDDGERDMRVESIEEIRSDREWKRFGCYVLVESFVFKRMDGSLLLNCDFRHTHRIQSKWE